MPADGVPADGVPEGTVPADASSGDPASDSDSQFSSAKNVNGKCETVGDASCGGDGQGAAANSEAGEDPAEEEVVPAQ